MNINRYDQSLTQLHFGISDDPRTTHSPFRGVAFTGVLALIMQHRNCSTEPIELIVFQGELLGDFPLAPMYTIVQKAAVFVQAMDSLL